MTLKSKFLLLASGIATVLITLMVSDRVRTARELMLYRVMDRADYFNSFIADISADRLERGEATRLKEILSGLNHFDQIAYLRVSDTNGRVIYSKPRPGISLNDRATDHDIRSSEDDIYDTSHEISVDGRRLGSIQLGLSLSYTRQAIDSLMWRGIALGGASLIFVLAIVWVGVLRLLRQIEELRHLAENMELETLPADPHPDTGTEIGRVAATLRDMHARLKTEERRRKAAESQKNEFFAMTVHDLKQPLTSLKAALDLLLPDDERKGYSPEQVRNLSKVANTSLKTLSAMVVDVLSISRLDGQDYSPEKERILLGDFMHECAYENSVSVKAEGKKWHFSVPGDIGNAWIFGDSSMLKRVVGNLVLNAIQYTPKDGAIELGLRWISNDKAAIYVSDEGEGIPDNFREAIFRKYQGMHRTMKNIGLGLAFCKMAAEEHSGAMSVKSAPGKGTEMSLVLPVARTGHGVENEIGEGRHKDDRH